MQSSVTAPIRSLLNAQTVWYYSLYNNTAHGALNIYIHIFNAVFAMCLRQVLTAATAAAASSSRCVQAPRVPLQYNATNSLLFPSPRRIEARACIQTHTHQENVTNINSIISQRRRHIGGFRWQPSDARITLP